MPAVVAFDPYTPKVNLDSKALAVWHAYSAVLREHLTHVLKQPVEARLQILKPGVCVYKCMKCAYGRHFYDAL